MKEKYMKEPLLYKIVKPPLKALFTLVFRPTVEGTEEYLNDGKLVAIFPEGTTNKTDDIMMPFKGGAVKIASDTGCDIVPFVISGKYKYFKKSIKIKFMPVMKVERGSLKAANKNLYETVRNELEKEYGVK